MISHGSLSNDNRPDRHEGAKLLISCNWSAHPGKRKCPCPAVCSSRPPDRSATRTSTPCGQGDRPAVGYYTQCLGFTLVSKDGTTARLRRDDVQIGLAVNGRDPEQAEYCSASALSRSRRTIRRPGSGEMTWRSAWPSTAGIRAGELLVLRRRRGRAVQEYTRRASRRGSSTSRSIDGKPYRVFFAKEPYGVCFCFTQPL